MNLYYDTHAHLNAENYQDNLNEIIQDAKENNVDYINVIGFDPKTNALANKIAKDYNLFASAGLHPTDVQHFSESDIKDLEFYLQQDITVAVGECGLDYYWHKDTKDLQSKYFNLQIALAKKYHKPLVIHVRDAFEDTYKILKATSSDGLLKGVMHCFSGSPEMAQRFLDLGLYISLGGPVTFKNAKTPKEVAKLVPLNRLLIETDCPYLAPHPYRGKENKPGYLPLIAREIASIKEISPEELATYTTNNGKKLFLNK